MHKTKQTQQKSNHPDKQFPLQKTTNANTNTKPNQDDNFIQKLSKHTNNPGAQISKSLYKHKSSKSPQ